MILLAKCEARKIALTDKTSSNAHQGRDARVASEVSSTPAARESRTGDAKSEFRCTAKRTATNTDSLQPRGSATIARNARISNATAPDGLAATTGLNIVAVAAIRVPR